MHRIPFLEAVTFAQAAVGRSAYAILDTVLLEAKDGKGSATGSSGDFFARREFDCPVDMRLCVAGKRLQTVLAASTADSVTLEVDGSTLIVDDGVSRSKFQTLDPDDPKMKFPDIFMADGGHFPIPADAIKKCLPAVCQVVTNDNLRLCAVLLDKDGYAVAFDRRRTHTVKIAPMPMDAIIPTEIAVVLSNLDGQMRCDEKFVTAEGDGWMVSGKVVAGPYGNWRKILQMVPAAEKVAPVDLCDNIRRAISCSENQKEPGILFNKGKIHVPGYSVECDFDTGFAFRIDPTFLQQALKAAGDGATIGYTDPKEIFLVKNGATLCGIMPLRLNETPA